MALTATAGPQQERNFPNLQGKAHHDIVAEAALIRGALYDLRDKTVDVVVLTLTANQKFDRTLIVGKLLIVIVKQDTVGGRMITWGSKFHGTNLITWVTTANSYSVFEFYPIRSDYALLVRWLSGGNL